MDAADLAAAWWGWIASSTLQATPLLAAAWAADRALVRRAWPHVLSAVWLCALLRLVLPPSLGSPWSVTSSIGGPAVEAAQAARSFLALELCAGIWFAGSLVVATARIAGRTRLGRQIESVRSAAWSSALAEAARRAGVRRIPRLGTLAGLSTPAVTGLWKPALLLPPAWLERPPTRRDAHALLHELTHVARRDLWLDEACALLRALFWFHPLVWVAAARVRALSELACDQAVARRLGREEAPAYRDTLVLAAKNALIAPAPGSARGFACGGSLIVQRIERLERGAAGSPSSARLLAGATAFALCACVLPMASASAGQGELREWARAMFADALAGGPQSCFTLHAAAMVLAAEPSPDPPQPGD